MRRHWKHAVVRACIGALGIAAVAGIVWGLAGGWAIAFAIFVVQLVLWTGLLALVFGTLAGLDGDHIGERVRPNEGIRRSLQNFGFVFALVCLVVGSTQALLTIVSPTGPDPRVIASVSAGARDARLLEAMTELWRRDPVRFQWIGAVGSTLSVAYLAAMLRGGYAVVQHRVLRSMLWVSRRIPLRLISVLDDATQRGLLRRIGGGYLFVHRTLQDHLARPVATHPSQRAP